MKEIWFVDFVSLGAILIEDIGSRKLLFLLLIFTRFLVWCVITYSGKRKKDSFYECFDDRPDRTFSFRYKSFFEKEESDWGESVNSERMSSKTWGSSSESDSDSESESDNESRAVGSLAERTLLGLPLSGPLKLEDLKKA